MPSEPAREISQPEQPSLVADGRPRSRWLALTLTLGWGVVLPGAAIASPPGDRSGAATELGDLPSPEDLPDVLPEVTPESSPPKRSAPKQPPVNDQPEPESSEDEDEDEGEGEGEGEGEPESIASEPEPEPAQQPQAAAPKIKKLKKPKWIKHTILPGERIDDIATRYDVRRGSLIRWNKLDENNPKLFAGRDLAVYTKHIPPPQQKLIYTVKPGDTWNKIASAHHVDANLLRSRWNSKVPRKFKAGQELVIWVDPLNSPDLLREPDEPRTKASGGTSARSASTASAASTASVSAAKLPLVKIKTGSVSVGKPNRGKIVNPLALPENKVLYTIRKPDECYGSSHTLHNLQLAIANFRRATGFNGDLVIGAISKRGGGRLKPHSSHQSGRDVDVRLPVKSASGSSDNIDDVDWDATWSLIQALVSTGEVQYIFLSTSRQKRLYKAAKRAGASKDMLERTIQYPSGSGTNHGIVRNASGHTAHFHVRFNCAANETRCESY
ncbi:Membrane-bound lytic murein transglycosylase D precursor [Enhygromyxa salina]|uniref:Membrane-bound lytic murein transglycosylase D n=1 Tax=Enhygromyxa salina TaxID=215803 RepID=A0A0C2D1H8_9BACT|nr:penicillin-insensitive murein endopeptidase [Enhygromyxa salina]KIG17096.1 Membrane-bound lytic murein transglycosylase D precursor [Enhygromyxa salina]